MIIKLTENEISTFLSMLREDPTINPVRGFRQYLNLTVSDLALLVNLSYSRVAALDIGIGKRLSPAICDLAKQLLGQDGRRELEILWSRHQERRARKIEQALAARNSETDGRIAL